LRSRRVFAVLLLAVLLACGADEVPPERSSAAEVVARVAGIEVTRVELEALAELLRARRSRRRDPSTSPGVDEALEAWIEAYLLKQELEARGLQDADTYRDRLAAIRARAFHGERQLARDTLIRALGEELELDESLLRKRYQDQAQRFTTTRIRVRQITVPDRATILGIRKQLADGADFETLAAHANLDPALRSKGGDLGWLDQRRMPSALIGPAHQLLAPGEVSEPFQDREARWNLVQLVGREKSALRDFEDVRDVLERELGVIESREILARLLAERRAAIEVERTDGGS
jgi:peptidyl-prolyl cis-trans isomerase C